LAAVGATPVPTQTSSLCTVARGWGGVLGAPEPLPVGAPLD